MSPTVNAQVDLRSSPPVALNGCDRRRRDPCQHRRGARRSVASAHVRDHQPPRRRQDDADREVPALRRRRATRRCGQGPRGTPCGDVGLDGAREAARHLDQLDRPAVPVSRPRREPARHARAQGLLRGHVPCARRRRRRRDGARHGQGHRVADAQAVRGLPQPTPAGAHVPQQVRPPRPRAARAARRDRAPDRPPPDAGHVAGRHRRRPARRRRSSARRQVHPLHPHRPRRLARPGGGRLHRSGRGRRGPGVAGRARRDLAARRGRRRRRRRIVPRR